MCLAKLAVNDQNTTFAMLIGQLKISEWTLRMRVLSDKLVAELVKPQSGSAWLSRLREAVRSSISCKT